MYHLAIFLALSDELKSFAEDLSLALEISPGDDYLVSSRICERFDIPVSIDYEHGGISWSSPIVGDFLRCKVLKLSESGPFAFVVPDVAFEVALKESEGKRVFGPAKDFQMNLDGCHQISSKEWGLLITQYVQSPQSISEAVSDLVALAN